MTQAEAWTAFCAAARATWLHIEQEAPHTPGHGYTRQYESCRNINEHHALLVAEGEAWAGYREAGGT